MPLGSVLRQKKEKAYSVRSGLESCLLCHAIQTLHHTALESLYVALRSYTFSAFISFFLTLFHLFIRSTYAVTSHTEASGDEYGDLSGGGLLSQLEIGVLNFFHSF